MDDTPDGLGKLLLFERPRRDAGQRQERPVAVAPEHVAAVDLVARLGMLSALGCARLILGAVRPLVASSVEDPNEWRRVTRKLEVAERAIGAALRLLVRSAR